MRLIKNPELKGILALIGILIVLAGIMLALTGKFYDWFGIRLTLKKPMTNKVVFISDRSGHPDIWVMKLDGSEQKPLTNDSYQESEPVVSPDGYQIAFISKRGTPQTQIFVMDADGSNAHSITKVTGSKSSLRFSTDGKSVLFICAGSVWRAWINEDNPDRLLPTHAEAEGATVGEMKAPYVWAGECPADGELAAVQTAGEGQIPGIIEGQIPVHLQSEEEGPKPLSDPASQERLLVGETVSADWAPTGKTLAVTMTAPTGAGILITDDLEAGYLSQLLLGGSMANPKWSPDGEKIAVQILKRKAQDDYQSIGFLVLDKTGENPKPFTIGDVSAPKWSPDGKRVFITLGKDIYSADPETGKRLNLTKGKGNNSDPAFAPVPKPK